MCRYNTVEMDHFNRWKNLFHHDMLVETVGRLPDQGIETFGASRVAAVADDHDAEFSLPVEEHRAVQSVC